jgi:imidazolonepropionase-like amidohydrolase
VLVQGNRIQRVGRGPRSVQSPTRRRSTPPARRLMPGMCEAHTHFSWNDAATLAEIQRMPLEEHVLWSGHSGEALSRSRLHVLRRRRLCQGAARCRDPQRDQRRIDPGPRYLAASQEITVAGGLGDETLPHLPWQEFSFGILVSGPEEMRKWVRMFLKYGVDSIKLNLSGDNFVPGARADTTWMSDEEVAVAVSEAHMRGKRVTSHARSCESIKQSVRHGIEVIYHASFTDEESLDMLEAHKDRHFVAPGSPSCTRC